MKTELVKVVINQTNSSNSSRLTELIVNYNDITIRYTRVGEFHENHKISTKQLKRYRDAILKEHPKKEHRLYFYYFDDEFYYSDRILEKRLYKNS